MKHLIILDENYAKRNPLAYCINSGDKLNSSILNQSDLIKSFKTNGAGLAQLVRAHPW
jgi:hypothetical protein